MIALDWRWLLAAVVVGWLLGRRRRRRPAGYGWGPAPGPPPRSVSAGAKRVVLAAVLISAMLFGGVLAANGAGAKPGGSGGPTLAGLLDGILAGAGGGQLPKFKLKPPRLKLPGSRPPSSRSGSRACPVAGRVSFVDSWHAPRSGHLHQGVDMMAAHGTPVVAVESGTIGRVGYAGIGGLRVWLLGRSGAAYYHAHLSAANVRPGERVRRGDQLGRVGNTGNAASTAPHLHFEIHPGGDGAPAVNPYPSVARWCRR